MLLSVCHLGLLPSHSVLATAPTTTGNHPHQSTPVGVEAAADPDISADENGAAGASSVQLESSAPTTSTWPPRPLLESGLSRLLGEHILVEAVSAAEHLLDDEEFIRQAVSQACQGANLTVVALHSHRFAPQGVSVVAVLAESHLSVHTWPELGYAAIDAYTCGLKDQQRGRALIAGKSVAEAVLSKTYHISRVPRGIPSTQSLQEAALQRSRSDLGNSSVLSTGEGQRLATEL